MPPLSAPMRFYHVLARFFNGVNEICALDLSFAPKDFQATIERFLSQKPSISHMTFEGCGCESIATRFGLTLTPTMSIVTVNQVYSPPELPQYLKDVYDLKAIVGIPTDDELVGIHSVIQMASKATEIRGLGDPLLLVRLSEHLFCAQMVPSMFNPYINVELSQHLFDIQMARYTQHARQKNTMQCESPSSNTAKPATNLDEVSSLTTNNAGTGADSTQSLESVQKIQGSIIQYAIEKSNQLSEEANKLMERANILIERSNELMERSSSRPAEQPSQDSAKFSEIFERMNGHLEHSNNLAGRLAKPIETMGDSLQTINRVLVRIQHAIVRVSQTHAPVQSSFAYASKDLPISVKSIDPIISGVNREFRIENQWLGKYLRFYGIAEEVFEDDIGTRLKEGQDHIARVSIRALNS
ncbi:hypothetical protein AG1IA_09562 [Rhizoctonia solani AG-1 IA]|uniref:Uncharacterized protein n=1 Tax=Thanatephorus cucumeris (strain AG1-IA) TaxID=983506 RepID=L8WHY8_THACA|nr:hypothetical protein AG1IA_09562 [Rhizoctonia solani AG-1 IA]